MWPGSQPAHFDDDTQADADILVGADGIRSTVRYLIDPAAPQPRYTGLLGFGAPAADTGLASTHDKMHMVFGKRAFFGYQINDDSSGGWFANLPRQTPMTSAEARAVNAEQWLGELREGFADDRSPAVDLLRRVDPATLLVGPLEDIPSMPTWSSSRMVLIGDAAHPTSPSSGQGASLAIESAVELARCLRDLPPDEAFTAYTHLRRDRVERIITMAARTNSDKAAGPIARERKSPGSSLTVSTGTPRSLPRPKGGRSAPSQDGGRLAARCTGLRVPLEPAATRC